MKNGLLFICFILSFVACRKIEKAPSFDIQGHRGARGLAPENTLQAFVLATNMGVNTLELDLVVSKDSLLVVSHEPFFSPDFCLDTKGGILPQDTVINIYTLTYDQIRQYDCGTLQNTRFPEQNSQAAFKPLLSKVIDSVEHLVKAKGQMLNYNIELKTTQQTDETFHPHPAVFSDLAYDLLSQKNITDRVTIQSFDFRTLQYFHENYEDISLALLIENQLDWQTNIDSLGFTPEIYSCYYELLTQQKIRNMQAAGMKVIPWTVNGVQEIEKLMSWKVDGIITDYPDRALNMIQKYE